MAEPAPNRRRRRTPTLPAWSPALLLALSLLPFATVHPGWRSALAVAAALMGGVLLLSGVERRVPPLSVLWVGALGSLALILSALPLLQVDAATRRRWQPGLADAVEQVQALAGNSVGPLALDAHNGLRELSLAAALFLLMMGVAARVRRSQRARDLSHGLLVVGVGLVGVALAHRLTGAGSIWWVSEVPAFTRAPFFAPFVNPNHGGVMCAALLPLAASMLLRRDTFERGLGAGALATLLIGVQVSGSRGAILAGAVGLLMWGVMVAGRRLRVAAMAGLLVGGVGLLLVGVQRVGESLSQWLVPQALGPGEDLFTGRGDVYQDALRVVASAPWAGVGHAGFDDGFRVMKSTPSFAVSTHAHQEVLQVAAEHGVVVLGIWLLLLGLVAARGIRRCMQPDIESAQRRSLAGYLGAAAALACACQFTFPLRIGALALLAALVTGAALGLGTRGMGRRPRGVKRGLTGVLVVLAVLALGAQALVLSLREHPSSPYGSSDLALAQADELLRAAVPKDRVAHARAADAYRRVLRRQPVRREALQRLSSAWLGAAELDGAVAALTAATQVYPTLPWPHRDLARLQRRLGDYDDARSTWRLMLACDLPEGSDRAYVEEALRGPGDPVAIATLALPERADRLAVGARVLERQEALVEAERLLRKASDMEPRYLAHLGAALNRWSRHDEALQALEPASDSCFVLRTRGEALLALARFDEALAALQQAQGMCADAAGDQDRALRIGVARSRLGLRDERGIRVLEVLLEEDPQDVPVRRLLLKAYRERGWDQERGTQLRWLVEAGRATAQEQRELLALGG